MVFIEDKRMNQNFYEDGLIEAIFSPLSELDLAATAQGEAIQEEMTQEQEFSQEQGSTLELDISIIHEPAGGIMSLSDFFGIPVFREDSTQAILEYQMRLENQLTHIGEQVFLQDDDTQQEELEVIRSQVFLDWPLAPPGTQREEEATPGLGNTIFAIQLVTLAFILLLMGYVRKRKKERKKKIHDIHHFGS